MKVAKKPTIKQVSTATNEALVRTEGLLQRMINLEVVLSSYFEFKKDDKGFKKFMDKKREGWDAEARARKDMDNK